MSPGPTNTRSEVRAAASLDADFSHRDPEVIDALRRVRTGILRAVGGENTHACVLFASSGTGAMEAIISSLPGKVLVVANGRYAERAAAIARRHGIETDRLPVAPYASVDPQLVHAALSADPAIAHVVVVHHETTTGVLVPLSEIGRAVAAAGRSLVVDGVGSVGGHPLDVVADHISFLAMSPNKCVESIPGLSMVVARADELQLLAGHARTYYFDLEAQWRRQQDDQFGSTIPVQALFALDRAVDLWLREGVEARVARYVAATARLREGLRRAGLPLLELPKRTFGNIITIVTLPAESDRVAIVDEVRRNGFTLYPNLGDLPPGQLLLATMGAILPADIDAFVTVLRDAIDRVGSPVPGGPSAH